MDSSKYSMKEKIEVPGQTSNFTSSGPLLYVFGRASNEAVTFPSGYPVSN